MKYAIQFLLVILLFTSCKVEETSKTQPVYEDKPYLQDYAVKYYFEVEAGENSLVYSATARAINCSVVVF